MNRLRGMRCYLIGAMDRVPDGGAPWRDNISCFLRGMDIIVLNPCDKPITIGYEKPEDRDRINDLKRNGRYDEVAEEIRLLRVVDLRMVDMSDFIICNLDISVHATGTYEEMFWANRLKRPILIHCEQGKSNVPNWLFGVLPHEFFFSNWSELQEYILNVNSSVETPKHYKRWMFFDYNRLTIDGQRIHHAIR